MIFPKLDNMKVIDDIRKKYDPSAKHVRPHITLVFPFESSIKSSDLEKHIIDAVDGIKPFNLSIKGITGTRCFGNYLFLNVEDGSDKTIELHEKLYTGILHQFFPARFKEVDFIPHITVGNIKNEYEFEKALEETKDIKDVFETVVKEISVEIIDENEDSIIEMEIPLL